MVSLQLLASLLLLREVAATKNADSNKAIENKALDDAANLASVIGMAAIALSTTGRTIISAGSNGANVGRQGVLPGATILLPISIAIDGVRVAHANPEERVQVAVQAGVRTGGALVGGQVGVFVGSMIFPGVGTVVGAISGSIAGSLTGLLV